MSITKKLFLLSSLLAFIIIGTFGYLAQGINAEIENQIKEGKRLVLYFSALWCGSGKRQKPLFREAREEFTDLSFYEIGSDLNAVRKKVLFKKCQVKGMPTFILFKDGKELKHLQGLQTRKS